MKKFIPKTELTPIGKIVKSEIEKTNQIRQNAKIEQYIIMPNHIHFILEIFDDNHKGTVPRAPTVEKFGKPTSKTVCTIVRYLKSGVTRIYNQKNKINIQLWQRGFYERIIRNEKEYFLICEYIKNNPINFINNIDKCL